MPKKLLDQYYTLCIQTTQKDELQRDDMKYKGKRLQNHVIRFQKQLLHSIDAYWRPDPMLCPVRQPVSTEPEPVLSAWSLF